MATEAYLSMAQIPKAVDGVRRDLFAAVRARSNPAKVTSFWNLQGVQAKTHLAFATIAAQDESLLGLGTLLLAIEDEDANFAIFSLNAFRIIF